MNKYFIVSLNIIFLFVLFIYEPTFSGPKDNNLLFLYSSIVIFLIILHLAFMQEKNWFRLDLLFLLGLFIVCFQWPIMISMTDVVPERFSLLFSNSYYINYGTWLCSIGVVSWIIGFWLISKEEIVKKNVDVVSYYSTKKISYFTLLVFLLFLITVDINYLTGNSYQEATTNYTGAAKGIAAYFQLLLNISIIIYTIFTVLNYRNKEFSFFKLILQEKLYFSLVLFYILIFVSAGDRGSIVQLISVLLVFYSAFIKEIDFKKFFIIFLIGSVSMTIIGILRSQSSISEGIDFSSFSQLTLSLSNSARTLYLALSEVPSNYDYFYGQFWGQSFLGIVPFLQGIYQGTFEIPKYMMTSDDFITYLRFGKYATSGEGTSIIADIYLNFSRYGVIFFMFVLGVFMKILNNKMLTTEKVYWFVLVGVFSAVAFGMGRAGYFSYIKYLSWGMVLAFIFISRKVVFK